MAATKDKAASHTHELGAKCLSMPIYPDANPRNVSYFCSVLGERATFDADPPEPPVRAHQVDADA